MQVYQTDTMEQIYILCLPPAFCFHLPILTLLDILVSTFCLNNSNDLPSGSGKRPVPILYLSGVFLLPHFIAEKPEHLI